MLQRTRKGRRELRALRGQLEIGIAALRRGDLDAVDEAALHVYLTTLSDRRGARLHERMDPTAHLDAAAQRGMPGKNRRR